MKRKNFQYCVDSSPHIKNAVFGQNSFFDPVTPFSQLYLIHRFDQPGIVSILLDSLGCLLACLLGDNTKDH